MNLFLLIYFEGFETITLFDNLILRIIAITIITIEFKILKVTPKFSFKLMTEKLNFSYIISLVSANWSEFTPFTLLP